MSTIQTRQQTPLVRHAGPPAPRPGAVPPTSGMTGRDIWRILRKRKWTIILPTLLFVILSVVGTELWLKLWPFYTADAFVSVNTPSAGILSPQRRLVSTEIVERIVNSHAAMVTREDILRKCLDTHDIKLTQWWKHYKTDKDYKEPELIEELEDSLGVGPLPNTNIIRISFTSWYKDEVATFATTLARTFEQVTNEQASQQNRRRITSLETGKGRVEQDLTNLRTTKARLLADVQLVDLRTKHGAVAIKIGALTKQLTDLQMLRAQADSSLATIEQMAKNNQLRDSPEVVQALNFDPRLQILRRSETTLAIQRDDLLRKFGPDHQQVKRQETRMKTIRGDIAAREEELVTYQSQALLMGRRSMVTVVEAQQLQVQQEYDKALAVSDRLQKTLLRTAELDAQIEAKSAELRVIDARHGELLMTAVDQRPIVLRARAETPREPSIPKRYITYPLGLDTTGGVLRAYKALALPTTVFIDRQGNESRRIASAVNEGVLRFFLKGLLNGE